MPEQPSKSDHAAESPGELRNRAEEMLRTGPADLSNMPVEDVQALVHELQVHQVELEIQNEELRCAQVELAESHDRFSDLYEFAPVGYVTFDPNGRIKETNLAAATMFGVNRKDLLGAAIESFVAPDSQDAFFLHKREVFSAEEQRSCELEMRRRDGTRLTVQLESIARETGPDDRCRTALIDVTEWRQVEEALEEANLLLRRERDFSERLIETAPSLILVLDPAGRVLRFNPAFAKLSGWSLPEAMGRDWFETFLSRRDRKRFKSAIRGTRIRGSVGSIVTRNGEDRLIEWFDTLLTSEEGDLIGLLWTGTDVTERSEFDKQLFRASEDEKKRIAVDLHDSLGSRLTGIGYRASGLSRKLRTGLPVEPEEADTIVEQIRDVIVGVRTLSQGLQPVNDEPEALADALHELADWADSSSALECRFLSADGKVAIHDPIAANHWYRIAQEAATNAMRHSNASLLTIRLWEEDGRIVLSLADNGSGFDPARVLEGGLGLQTMEYRARAIRAELAVNSRKDSGTVVECVLSPD